MNTLILLRSLGILKNRGYYFLYAKSSSWKCPLRDKILVGRILRNHPKGSFGQNINLQISSENDK